MGTHTISMQRVRNTTPITPTMKTLIGVSETTAHIFAYPAVGNSRAIQEALPRSALPAEKVILWMLSIWMEKGVPIVIKVHSLSIQSSFVCRENKQGRQLFRRPA
jgi:hypothetical protein